MNCLPAELQDRWELLCHGEMNEMELFQTANTFALKELTVILDECGIRDNKEKFLAVCRDEPDSPVTLLTQLASNCQRGLKSLSRGVTQEQIKRLLKLDRAARPTGE